MKNILIRLLMILIIGVICFLLLRDSGSLGEMLSINGNIGEVNNPLSLTYLAFLAIVVFAYYTIPRKYQWTVLLAGSLVFYLISGFQYIIFLIGSSAATFVVAKQMSVRIQEANGKLAEAKDIKSKKAIKGSLQKANRNLLWIAVICTLGVMVIIKYTYFFIENINNLLNVEIPLVHLLMPLGLSFYTFMLIAYLMDVYRGKYEAEKNFFKFLLFSSFFPHVSQGPISRYDELGKEQLTAIHSFDYRNFCFGMQRILWGFFMKLVLADRLSIFVTGVYSDYENQSWLMLAVAALAFSIQIYVDFYSSMEIAIGSAQLFGIKLAENFMRPYFSKSMPEFWRRWHITLGTWFKDYVFYPIAISKNLMKFSRWSREKFGANVSKILAVIPPIMGVWVLTGLWHGAAWNFVAWGVYHGILIVLSSIFAEHVTQRFEKLGIKTETKGFKVLQMIKVFILCSIGRVFFVSDSIGEAFHIFARIGTLKNSPNGLINIADIPLILPEYGIIIITTILLFIVSTFQEVRGSLREQIDKASIFIRWPIWLILIFATLIFGVYGDGAPAEFIYEEF